MPGAVVSAVARRHGVMPQQVFGWRREARRAREAPQDPTPMTFVPATTPAASALPSGPSPVLNRIAEGHPNRRLDELLPWAYARAQDLKAVA